MLFGYVIAERFRESGRSKKKRDYIIDFPSIESKEQALQLIGLQVEYVDNYVKIRGRILKPHGVKGKVRARFVKPLPGQFWRGKVYLKSPVSSEILEKLKVEQPSSQTV
ncbi:MAG: 50S ribosomal protein L35ae [Nitrososphaerota archaeon]